MLFAHSIRTTLWLLIATGLFGALRLSYSTFSRSGEPCPDFSGVYICYVVLIGYGIMVLAQFGTWRWKRPSFYSGWAITFIIAAVGTVLELINGETCPKSADNLPMCYVSLGLCICIFALYVYKSIYFDKKADR